MDISCLFLVYFKSMSRDPSVAATFKGLFGSSLTKRFQSVFVPDSFDFFSSFSVNDKTCIDLCV